MADVPNRIDENGVPQAGGRPSKWWAPRIWLGCSLPTWARLLARNRFAVGPSRLHLALGDTAASVGNSALAGLQWLVHARRLAKTEIKDDPLFIIGHWRCGTTLLHEMLILDERHTSPTTYECLAPNHFLLTQWIAERWFRFVIPPQRPMDNMAISWEHPQEDEFALCILGVPSPYRTIAFPNRPSQCPEYLDLEGLSQSALAHWKRALVDFLKQVTLRNAKRIVLKSPPHTCRIPVLLNLFPRAQFIHIVRDPYVVFPSTVHLWKSLYRTHGLQRPTFEGLEEQVLSTFVRMHRRLDETRHLVDPARFCELRYEDLVADPISAVRRLYEQLELGDFDQLAPRLAQHWNGLREYRTNRYALSARERDLITRRWGPIIRKYGYAIQPTQAPPAHGPHRAAADAARGEASQQPSARG